jgi:hypothetical protein
MRAIRMHAYQIAGYGQINFARSGGEWRVIWTRTGGRAGTAIGWLPAGAKPGGNLAVFYCQVACALEDGKERHFYFDKKLTPPARVPVAEGDLKTN